MPFYENDCIILSFLDRAKLDGVGGIGCEFLLDVVSYDGVLGKTIRIVFNLLDMEMIEVE